jgi:hypothetical protein
VGGANRNGGMKGNVAFEKVRWPRTIKGKTLVPREYAKCKNRV